MDLTPSELELLTKITQERSKYKRRMAVCGSLVALLAAGCVYSAFQLRDRWNEFAAIPKTQSYEQFSHLPPAVAKENYEAIVNNNHTAVEKAAVAFTAGGLLYFCSIAMILLAVSMLRAMMEQKPRAALVLRLVERLEELHELHPPYETY